MSAHRTPEELVVFCHLRWTFVWQRPQHLLSRLAEGRRLRVVEEPLPVEGIDGPRLRSEQHGPVERIWLEVPGKPGHVCFSDPRAATYAELLAGHLGDAEPGQRAAWLYTPMALPVADALDVPVLVYDVMDDLASFAGAPTGLRLRQLETLRRAAVVFTGGRSLHRGATTHRTTDIHCFPSGVEPGHYARATELRRRDPERPVAGYVGVIDERLDLGLIADLAAALPEWEIRMVGPVVKIDEADLPKAPNITYPGSASYQDLPEVMAGFDVALMPFALNEATRSISPTKTLEYLAAGLPVVSTRVPDVVSDFAKVVDLQDDGAGFAAACRRVIDHCATTRAGRAETLLHDHHWDTIATRMDDLLVRAHQRTSGAMTGRGTVDIDLTSEDADNLADIA
jgi:glycosyltransferase involved in cell wall biosynthesis